MSGKPKLPPTTEERATIVTMAADGVSQCRIAEATGRSRTLIKNILDEPETQRIVADEKAELAELYRSKARTILVSIDSSVIEKANLLQRATSSAICLDKAQLLTGLPTSINLDIFASVAEAIRSRNALPSPPCPAPALPPPE